MDNYTYDEEYESENISVSDDSVNEELISLSRYNNIMGITCYINSILHILQQIPNFVK